MASVLAQKPAVPGISPHKLVTKEKLAGLRQHLLDEDADHAVLPETPASDNRALAELLGVEAETVPNFVCRFAKGGESCANCGRAFSILDMAKSGLKVHSKEFIKATIFGQHGYVFNNVPQLHECYDCGEKATSSMDYGCPMYMCGSPLDTV